MSRFGGNLLRRVWVPIAALAGGGVVAFIASGPDQQPAGGVPTSPSMTAGQTAEPGTSQLPGQSPDPSLSSPPMTADPSFVPPGRPEPVPGDAGPTTFVPVPNGWGEAEGEPGQFNTGVTAEVALRDGTLIVDLGAGRFQLPGEPNVVYLVPFVTLALSEGRTGTALVAARFVDESGAMLEALPVTEDDGNTDTALTGPMLPLGQGTVAVALQIWVEQDGRDRFVESPIVRASLTGAVPLLVPEGGAFTIDSLTPSATPTLGG